jgi:N-acyl homoserine lactone hydrolase
MTGTPQWLYLMRLGGATILLEDGSTLFMSLGCYLIQMSDGTNILIDSGYPPDHEQPPDDTAKSVLEYLTEMGLTPDDIHIVVVTHFDIDHAGYNDVFTKAEHIIQRRHYEIARSGDERYASIRNHWDNPALKYRLIDGDLELSPGVTLLETNGHAPGHQSVLVRLPNTGTVLLAIDAVMLERLFTPERKAGGDHENEAELRASTQKLLDIVQRENVVLTVFGHEGQQWETLKIAPDYYD